VAGSFCFFSILTSGFYKFANPIENNAIFCHYYHLCQHVWDFDESFAYSINLVAPFRKGIRMIRSELFEKLAVENPELKPEEIEKIVDLFFNQIMQKLAEGGRVELRGFGAFSTRQRKPRIGRNPRTGESVEVPAKRVPYFKPGKEIRERLNKR